MLEFIATIFIATGTLFLLIATLGLLRMPDAITRMHAATKASTLGTVLIIIGAIGFEPSLWFKLLLLALFILLSNPLSSSILARSHYLRRGFFNKSRVDAYKEES